MESFMSFFLSFLRRPRLMAVLIVLAVLGAVAGGLWLRRWAWDASETARYPGDVRNAYRWGRVANRFGYLNLYERQEPNAVENKNDQLDYPPLRLLIMTRWQRWTRTVFPEARWWSRQYEFNAPLLRLNSTFELASAVGAFLLVTLWRARWELRKAQGEVPPGWISTPGALRRGALAALLVWLNPAVIWDAHCWPQWDVWVVAIFLFAALAASLDRWWIAGGLLGLGALLKGQTLLILPLFLLWPLFGRRISAAAKVAVGFLLVIVFAGSAWFLGSFANGSWELHPPAVLWLARATAAALLLFPWTARNRWPRLAALAVAALLLLAPGGAGGSVAGWLVAIAALALAWRFEPQPPRQAWLWVVTGAGAALVLCVPLFSADLAWVRIGWLYGSHHYPMLRKGRAQNLPALLEGWFPQWQGRLLPGVRLALVTAYAAGLAACARAAARAARIADPRLLACLAAPWALFYAVMPQMHERYFVFAAAATAAPAVLIPEAMLLLHLAITLLALLPMIPLKLLPGWIGTAAGDLRPEVSWLSVLCALGCLAVALRRRPAATEILEVRHEGP
jgi:hypothetical protein